MVNKEIKIRKASLKDLEDLVKLGIFYEKEEGKIAGKGDIWRVNLNKKTFEKDLKEWLKDKNNYTIVAEKEDKKIVGFFKAMLINMPSVMKTKIVCSLKELYVLPNYRGRKISSKLMRTMIKIIKKKTEFFTIHVSPNNKKAISIYLKRGFKPSYLCLSKKTR